MRSPLIAIALVSAVALSACGSDDDTATPASSPATSVTEPAVDTTEAPATTEAPPETAAPTTEAAPATTEATLADLEIAPDGPYDVGVTTITIDAESDRPLTLDVWFPVVDAGEAPLHQ